MNWQEKEIIDRFKSIDEAIDALGTVLTSIAVILVIWSMFLVFFADLDL